jgi:hypothetical protein
VENSLNDQKINWKIYSTKNFNFLQKVILELKGLKVEKKRLEAKE